MRAVLVGLIAVGSVWAQAQNDDFHVYRDPPRLFLSAQRQRLLERERERNSLRWQYFDAAASTTSPEPGFAAALYYRVAHENSAGRKAIDWALSPAGADLRQLALVYDWCSPLLTRPESDRLGEKIQQGVSRPATDLAGQAARALATIAIADRMPDAGNAVLQEIVTWWRKQPPAKREELYPLMEFLHAVRDNTKVELRQGSADYFNELPLDYVSGFYPATLSGPDNDFRVPVFTGAGEPDVKVATKARAAGLAMVALDTNAVNYQFVQGMLMNDRFVMRGALGAPYEFLWANPYQPGLAYQTLPLVFHDTATGHVFARTSWEEDATWIGYFDGALQLFRNGGVQTVRKGTPIAPLKIGEAVVTVPADATAVKVRLEGQQLFVIGLAAKSEYAVEIDDQELDFLESDIGGTLVVSSAPGTEAGVRIRPHGAR
ncbi:MAG: hypothetical protein ABIR70_17300 [Bryobacteraceae bacterium]